MLECARSQSNKTVIEHTPTHKDIVMPSPGREKTLCVLECARSQSNKTVIEHTPTHKDIVMPSPGREKTLCVLECARSQSNKTVIEHTPTHKDIVMPSPGREKTLCVLECARSQSNKTVQYAFVREFTKQSPSAMQIWTWHKKRKVICAGEKDLHDQDIRRDRRAFS